jgi:hypothetical protein
VSTENEKLKQRLRDASARAQAWVDAKPGDEHLGDYIANRAMGRDIVQMAEQTLTHLSDNSMSVNEAEQIAIACEQSLESTPKKRQAALRGQPELIAELQTPQEVGEIE